MSLIYFVNNYKINEVEVYFLLLFQTLPHIAGAHPTFRSVKQLNKIIAIPLIPLEAMLAHVTCIRSKSSAEKSKCKLQINF